MEKRYAILVSVMTGMIMVPIDASMVNVILPTLTEVFHTDISTAQWVPVIYLLTVSSLLLFYGRLGDVIGYKKVFLYGLGGFVISSGLCGLAPTMFWLIVFRAVQGLTAGMMMAVPFAIITASFPPTELGRALGIFAISISTGLAIGPSLGGFLTGLFGWRFTFLINLPIGVVALIVGFKVIPPFERKTNKLDYWGAIAAFVFMFSTIMIINRLQSDGMNIITIVSLTTAIASGLMFFIIESRTSAPMLNLKLFQSATFSFACLSSFFNFVSQYVMVFLTPFFLQRALHCSPAGVGKVMTAFPLAVIIIAPVSGALSDRPGTRLLSCIGGSISCIALALMGLLPSSATPLDVALRLAIFGIGTGVFQSPNTSAAMSVVPRENAGVASAIVATVRNVGMISGIAIAGAVLHIFVDENVLGKHSLNYEEGTLFLTGLRYAYFSGAFIAALTAITSFVRSKQSTDAIKTI
ncbi:MAG: MFS transporter [Deltaproteobacteria bacterium]|nr:MFS transporter [Deltaproteobacteria bacterium]